MAKKKQKVKKDEYQAIGWLVSRIFMRENFLARIDAEGVDSVLEECPYDDLTRGQRRFFDVMISLWQYRLEHWWHWSNYKRLRRKGVIPDVDEEPGSPWEP